MPPQLQGVLETLTAELPLEFYLVVGAIMFAIGAWGALVRRNAVVVFMCVELMINAVNLSLVAFADYLPDAGGLGQNYAVLVIAIAAAEVAVGLAIVLAVFRSRRTVNVDEINTMRGLEGAVETVGQQLIIAAIPALPALVFVVLALFGRLLGENAQYVAILGVTISLVFSAFALYFVIRNELPIEFSVSWIDLGAGGSFSMGVYIDGLAAVMLVVVCFVSLMIQLYSGGFMEGDRRFAWYYAVLNLFTASMLGLVLAPNFIELYIFWELVGLCSYLLVGHWFEKPSARDAAQKAFIVTRIGDAALFIAICIFWATTGTTAFDGIADAAQSGFIAGSVLTTAVVLVFVGAIGKSAQFPLHVWLPDAMEGPTPVSALIHAATMVAAGVYLVARTYDIFVQSETAMLTVAYIGGFTALMAATMALVKKDIKRVVAYSTVSQLGYMMLGLGVGSYTAGFFHLYNHAFFKALLFLCAGSIIYAMNSYSLPDMGGLRRRMPLTFWTMVLAGLSLAGIFPFSGFWSKDAIVASTYDEHYYVLFGMALLTVFLTAFYIFRAIFLAFTGEPRSDGAREAVESPGIMTGPMVILAFLAVVSGFVGIPDGFLGLPVTDYFAEIVAPSEFAREALELEPHPFSFILAAISVGAALLGIGLAYVMYVRSPELARTMADRFRPVHTFLDKGWYFDALYGATFVRGAKALGRVVREFDRRSLGGLVGGVGGGTTRIGEFLRRLQTGGVQNYALFILLSVLIIGVIVGAQYTFLVVALVAVITIAAFAVGGQAVITTVAILVPLLGAIVMLVLPPEERTVRYAALAISAVPLLISLYVFFAYGDDLGASSLTQNLTWIESLNVGYRVGLDGLGFGMFFLSALLTVIAVVASWDIQTNLRQYFAMLFVAELGMLGVFAAQDLVLFYVFFEITLIPMYLMVGIWGDENRRAAAIKFFVYTFLGSTTMLAGFLALGILADDFSIEALQGGAGLGTTAQIAIAAPVLLGLLIKVPAVPLHSWLLDVYVSSPTSTNVMLSGVLPKLGTYGLIKIAVPLLPQGVEPFLPFLAAFGVINIVYGAFVAFMQPDLKALIAYSSIGTLGFILLGISSGNAVGINGAVMQQVTHGLYSALLFVLVGIIASRTGTRQISELGGLATRMPWAGGLLALGALAAMGLPGLAVFVSEFMSILGGYQTFPVAGVLAATGIVFSAMYLLYMLARVDFGPEKPAFENVRDAGPVEMAAIVPLALLLIVLGIFPSLLIAVQRPAVEAVLAAIGG